MKFLYLLSAIALFGSCAQPAAPAPEDNFADSLDAYMRTLVPADGPGMAVLVAKPGGKVLFSNGYGLADLKTKTPITPSTLFNLGSVTKTMVGIGILQLQAAGKLSVEDPILNYFPDFKNKALVKDIRIKHLLSHTSGLPDNRPVAKDSIFFLTANDAQNWAPILQNDSLLFEPGAEFEYSNPAFNGLALIIEKVSGMKWQDYLKKNLFEKAGMSTSLFTDGAFPDTGVAHAYQQVNGKWEEYDFGEYPTFCAAGNGGGWSSVEGLLKYEEAIQKNILLDSALMHRARSVFRPENWKDTAAPFTGFDWFVRPLAGWNSVGHEGDQGGFRADYVYFPEQGYFIAILSNGSQELEVVRAKIVELLKSEKVEARSKK